MQAPGAPNADPNVAFILELGQALQHHGVPARQIERVLSQAAARFDMTIQVFATVTALIVTFGSAEHSRTSLVRLEPTDIDLGGLTALDRLVHRFLAGHLSVAEMRLELAHLGPRTRSASMLGSRAGPSSLCLGLILAALGAAAWAGLLGGGYHEAAAAALAGALLEAVTWFSERHSKFTREFTAVAGIIAGASVTVVAVLWPPLAKDTAIIAALVPLLPGLALVTAAEELASKDVVTGSARLLSASLVFAQLIFGVAIGAQVARVLPGTVGPGARVEWPLLAQLCMLVPAVFSLVLRLRAELGDLGWFFAAGVIGFLSGRAASQLFGLEIGAFAGAFMVGAAGNALARYFERPALLTIVPGVLVLVPGSLGFRSASELFAAHPLEGVRAGFSAIIVAVALATGLMLASSLVPPRRAL